MGLDIDRKDNWIIHPLLSGGDYISVRLDATGPGGRNRKRIRMHLAVHDVWSDVVVRVPACKSSETSQIG